MIRIPIEARSYVQTLLMITTYRGKVKIEGRNVKENFRVQNALMPCLNSKNGKVPGNDGLIVHFFKGLWNF